MNLHETQNVSQEPQIKQENRKKLLSAIKFLALVAILIIIFLLLRKPIIEWLNLSNLPSTGEPTAQQSTPQSFTERVTEITEGKKVTYTPVIQVAGNILYQKEQEIIIDDVWLDEEGDTITGDLTFQNANIKLDENSIATSNAIISSNELDILDNGITVDEIQGLSANGEIDAYQNLLDAGRLNNNSDSDILTRGQGDTRFLLANGSDTYLAGNTLTFNGNTDFNGDLVISDQNIVFDTPDFNLFSVAGNLGIRVSGESDNYLTFTSSSNSAQLLWDGYTTNKPGFRINTSSNRLEYRDENESSWTALDSLGGSSLWTDGGSFLYPTGNEDIQLANGNWIGSGNSANQPYLTFDDSNNYFEFIGGYVGIGTTTPYAALDILGDSIVRGDLTIKETSADTEGWTATSTSSAPQARSDHVGVWTGSEIIVWGGWNGSSYTNTGSRYNPSTGTWTATTTTNAPSGRAYFPGVWTGSKLLVWGGYDGSELNTGGIYDPTSNSWSTITTTGAPSTRHDHTAVWTGEKMVIWGGYDGADYVNTGGIYDPQTDTWTATTTTSAPTGRGIHTAIWTGSKMIIWGGRNLAGNHYNTGGLYDPLADSWTATTTTNAPTARRFHIAVWTGRKMIIWAGYNGSIELNTGGLYDPSLDSWTATTTTNVPTARELPTASWTGDRLIVWGGWDTTWTNTGGLYNPDTDTWSATTTTSAPSARRSQSQIWTGSEMIIWGGEGSGGVLNTGSIYSVGTETGGKVFIQKELTVDGNIFATGTVTSGGYHSTSGADVAENYPTEDSTLLPNEIVEINTKKEGFINRSSSPYSKNILGVISTKPGLLLSQSSSNYQVAVALSGRVPVNVSTINGSIKSGDPITSSNIPGVGMKATKPGFILGKALDDFQATNKTGVIDLFVNITWFEPEEFTNLVNTLINDYNNKMVAGSLDTIDSLAISYTLTAQNGEFSTISTENAHVTKDLQVGGLLSAYQIETELLSAKDQKDIVIKLTEQLGKTALIIQNSIGEAVFKVESTGKISIKDTGDNASVGTAVFKKGETSVKVSTHAISEQSKIFITPYGEIENPPTIWITEKANGYFVVIIDKAINEDLSFDWWVIN